MTVATPRGHFISLHIGYLRKQHIKSVYKWIEIYALNTLPDDQMSRISHSLHSASLQSSDADGQPLGCVGSWWAIEHAVHACTRMPGLVYWTYPTASRTGMLARAMGCTGPSQVWSLTTPWMTYVASEADVDTRLWFYISAAKQRRPYALTDLLFTGSLAYG